MIKEDIAYMQELYHDITDDMKPWFKLMVSPILVTLLIITAVFSLIIFYPMRAIIFIIVPFLSGIEYVRAKWIKRLFYKR